ncbi:MAG: hypothetical protein DRQ47_04725 [Gammaproteobacteria bacterium]|nr:MAG: hypothetical protein DRQ47_04725 [Gammaproteobacteria bacterium]
MTKAADFISESCATFGDGDLLLNGAVSSFGGFRDAWSINTEVYYSIIDGVNREAGVGTFNGLSTITRDTILSTTINGVYNNVDPVAIDLQGASQVSCTLNADTFEYLLTQSELIEGHLTDIGNPHDVTAEQVSYESSADPTSSETDVQRAMHDHAESIEERVASCNGIIQGGVLSGSGTLFSVTAGAGKIYDSYSNPGNTGIKNVTWPNNTAVTLDMASVNIGITYIVMSDLGVVVQVTGGLSPAYFRNYILLGQIKFINGAIVEVTNTPSVIKQTATDLYDLLFTSLTLDGNDIEPVDSNLQVYVTAGSIFFPGINYYNDIKDPNNLVTIAQGSGDTPITMRTLLQDGTLSNSVVTIPKQFNPSAVELTALSGGSATIHRLYALGFEDTTREFVLLYGQNEYVNSEDAKDNLDIDTSQTEYPTEVDSMLFLGYICVDSNAVDFTDVSKAWIVNSVGGNSNASSAGVKDPDAVRWQGPWDSLISYLKNDWVLDGVWGAVVVADTTTDRPAPQAYGNPNWLVPDTPPWVLNSRVARVKSGLRINNLTEVYVINKLRVGIPDLSSSVIYRVLITNNLTGVIDIGQAIIGSNFNDLGWNEVTIDPIILNVGSDTSITLVSENISDTTDYNHGYTYAGSDKNTNPANGETWRDNDVSLRISTTERGGVVGGLYDELNAIVAGSIIKLAAEAEPTRYVTYDVVSQTDNTTWFEYEVLKVEEGAGGYPLVGEDIQNYFTVQVQGSTQFGSVTGHFVGSNQLSGELQIGDGVVTTTQDAYGIDVYMQKYTASDDWGLVSYSGSGAGGVSEGTLPSMGKNLIINGDFSVWQRGEVISSPDLEYTADRWVVKVDGNVAHAVSPDANDRSILNALNAVIVTPEANQQITYRREDVRVLSGKTLTLSFLASAGTFGMGFERIKIFQYFGTSGDAEVEITVATNLILTSELTRYTFTFTLPSVSGKVVGDNDHLSIRFYMNMFETNNSGVFQLSEVQLEVGSEAHAFELTNPAIQLHQCRRYYWKSASRPDNQRQYTDAAWSALFGQYFNFPVTMRVSPDIQIETEPVYENCSLAVVCNGNVDGFGVNVTALAAGTYSIKQGVYTADAEVY